MNFRQTLCVSLALVVAGGILSCRSAEPFFASKVQRIEDQVPPMKRREMHSEIGKKASAFHQTAPCSWEERITMPTRLPEISQLWFHVYGPEYPPPGVTHIVLSNDKEIRRVDETCNGHITPADCR